LFLAKLNREIRPIYAVLSVDDRKKEVRTIFVKRQGTSTGFLRRINFRAVYVEKYIGKSWELASNWSDDTCDPWRPFTPRLILARLVNSARGVSA